jgi:hypothetical protein
MWRENVNYVYCFGLSLHAESWAQLCLSTTIMIFYQCRVERPRFLTPPEQPYNCHTKNNCIWPQRSETSKSVYQFIMTTKPGGTVPRPVMFVASLSSLRVILTWLLHTWQTHDSKDTHPTLDEWLSRNRLMRLRLLPLVARVWGGLHHYHNMWPSYCSYCIR